MSDALIAKLAFNGYHVTFFNHEGRFIDENHYPTSESILSRGFEADEFPTAEEFVEEMYRIYGDTVGMITDNMGVVLYDNMLEMNRQLNDPMFR